MFALVLKGFYWSWTHYFRQNSKVYQGVHDNGLKKWRQTVYSILELNLTN